MLYFTIILLCYRAISAIMCTHDFLM